MSSYPCPFCRATASLEGGCPACGRAPDPDAAEVIRLDAEIPALIARVEQARQALASATVLLAGAQQRREAAAARVRAARMAATRPAAPVPAARPSRPEASTLTVQNILFLLGGLLLGAAAIVFTAVAWARFGMGGRAALLVAFTAFAFSASVLALRRGLTATAETFAAVGLLLVVLDGYAAWYVDLFGVAGGSARAYAGAVCAVTAAVAAGYAAATGLIGPRFAALVAAQPVLPLIAAPRQPSATGWAVVLLAVAAFDLAVVRARPRLALRVLAWTAYGGALLASVGSALVALLPAAGGPIGAAGGGTALVAGALLLVAGGLVAASRLMQAVAGGALVVALAVALGRYVDAAAVPGGAVPVAAVLALLAVAVARTARLLPPQVRPGPRVGGLAVTGFPLLLTVPAALIVAARTAAAAQPVFNADLGAYAVRPDEWRLPAVIALLTAGLAVLLPRAVRLDGGVAGGALVVLAAPANMSLPWWSASAIDVAAAAALALLAVRASGAASAAFRGAVAALLAGHAVLAGLGRPASTAAVLAALMLVGVAVPASAGPTPHNRLVGGLALSVGLLAGPAGLAAGLAAARVEPWWVARATIGAAALLLVPFVAVRRTWPHYRWYAFATVLVGAFSAPVWAVLGAEPPGVYAALALLIIGAAAALHPHLAAGLAAVPPGLALAWALAPALAAVLVAPYAWLDEMWTGRPGGTGLAPTGAPPVHAVDAVALGTLAVAALPPLARTRGWRVAAWWAGSVAAVALPVALAAARAPWPAVAAAGLLIGLGGALAVALGGRPGTVAVALPLAGAGLAGGLPTESTTLAALGLTLVAAAVAGAAGRTLAVRLAGWLTAVAAGLALAAAAGLAADLPLRGAAFGVLAVAAVALAVGTALAPRRPVESVAVQAAAHAGAVTALLLTLGAVRYAAAISTLWGVVIGLRALRPGEAATRRRALVVAGAAVELLAWWLLMSAEQVALVEAYTLPTAAVALLAGLLALRGRPALTSWVTYGPALAAAFLPSLASVLVGDGQPLRRLLLGTAAIGVVAAGALRRRQAPVVVAGVVLAAVALHELVLVWDLLPRWIPLAAGGLLLVGLAMTLERRRRDLARVRRAVARMT